MSWNLRVVHRDDELAIHEAYYEEGEETPRSITENPAEVAAGDLAGLRRILARMQDAINKPVLEYDQFVKKESEKKEPEK
jgi:hypothetical protein